MTRAALQNAASIAALLLTTECLVADKPEEGCRRWRRHARHGRHGRHDVIPVAGLLVPKGTGPGHGANGGVDPRVDPSVASASASSQANCACWRPDSGGEHARFAGAQPDRALVRVCCVRMHVVDERVGSATVGEQSFSGLVADEHRGLIAAAVMIVGDSGRAEELVQEAFAAAYERWDEVSAMDQPGAWVRRVVINAAISVTRRRGSERRALVRLMSRRGDHQQQSVDLTDHTIWRVVGSLPDSQATAVALHYGADLSVATIADEMDLSTSAVKALLHRARTTLRVDPALERLFGEEEQP